MPSTSTARYWLFGAALPLLLLAATLAGCVSVAGGGSRAPTPSPLGIPTFPPEGPEEDVFLLVVVSFHSSTGFTSALQSVTNLGLQLAENCTSYQYSDVRWQSQDERLRFASAAQLPLPAQRAPTLPPNSPPPMAPTLQGQPSLEVIPTPLAPSDWLQRLAALPSVVAIYDGYGGCPLIPVDLTPVPGVLYFLGETVWAEDVRVQFAATGASGYGAALATISALGFRL
ncbi:MAG TPA: hypothetical protein VHI51_14730, partial [Ktedonobacterales bacterium]|nr:hypothetical protein [Ktedonobacterales bacterium]